MTKPNGMTVGELKFFLNELQNDYKVSIQGESLGMCAVNHELKSFSLATYPKEITQEQLDQFDEALKNAYD
jgi:hypothetical protein